MFLRKIFRLIFFIVLAVTVVVEGYYIFLLKDAIDKQTEEMKHISLRLQSLKTERSDLHEELSAIEKLKGEKKNGNSAEGQR